MLDSIIQDIRLAARAYFLRRKFAVTALLTLVLGIGGTTAVFSVVEAVILRPLPYPHPERIVFLHGAALTTSTFQEWKSRTTSYLRFAAVSRDVSRITGQQGAEEVPSALISEEFFPLLGVRPYAGRTLVEGDFRPEAASVVVISNDLALHEFGSAAGATGRKLTIDRDTYEIVGVLPEDRLVLPHGRIDLFLPLRSQRSRFADALGLLRPGITIRSAQAEAQAIAKNWNIAPGVRGSRPLLVLARLDDAILGDTHLQLLVVLSATIVIQLIACGNVANLLLARAADREREFSLRVALGATPGRIWRQVITETLLLSVVAGIVAPLLSLAIVRCTVALTPYHIPRIENVSIDVAVLGYTLFVVLGSGFLVGSLPAVFASRRDLYSGARSGRNVTSARSRRRVRATVIVAETSLSIVLLVSAGLLVRTYANLAPTHPGFAYDHVLFVSVSTPAKSPEEQRQCLVNLMGRVRAINGIRAVAAATDLPMTGMAFVPDVWLDGVLVAGRGQRTLVNSRSVSAEYLNLMGLPVVMGRYFSGTDRDDTEKVTIVNEAFARRFLPGESALNRRLGVAFGSDKAEYTIVGVVRDSRMYRDTTEVEPEMLVPFSQVPYFRFSLVAQTSAPPATQLASIRAAIREADRQIVISDLETMEEFLSQSVVLPRFRAAILAGFAGIALVLAGIGIYGVISYSVAGHQHEIGVRLALGAPRSKILSDTFRQGAVPGIVGIILGSVASLASTNLLSHFLYGVTPADAKTFAGVAAIMCAVILMAACPPACRAITVDPIAILREE